jgi:hypothetical protein
MAREIFKIPGLFSFYTMEYMRFASPSFAAFAAVARMCVAARFCC